MERLVKLFDTTKNFIFNSKVLSSTSLLISLFTVGQWTAFGKEILNQITLKELNNSPLRMSWVPNSCEHLLWASQCNEILSKYNPWVTPRNLWWRPIFFPNVLDSIKGYFPEKLEDFLKKNKQLSDRVSSNKDIVFVVRANNWRTIFWYYKWWKLFMATYTSLWSKWKSTPQKTYTVSSHISNKRSKTYDNAPMPYSVTIDKGGWYYIHAWVVWDYYRSHGCIRIPWLYSKIFYENVSVWTKVIVDTKIVIN